MALVSNGADLRRADVEFSVDVFCAKRENNTLSQRIKNASKNE